MKHIYGNVYQDSNGEFYMIEKNLLDKNSKITNLSKLSKEKEKEELEMGFQKTEKGKGGIIIDLMY